MVANLLESLIVLLLLLAICGLLPAPVLRDDFVVRGTILSIGFVGALMSFVKFHMEFGIHSGFKLFVAPLFVLLLTMILLGFLPKFRAMRYLHSAILWLSDRMTVFLYILIPLYIALFVYIVFRNIV
jgi:hypothetical protein